jgi:acyl-CoA thioesterase-1
MEEPRVEPLIERLAAGERLVVAGLGDSLTYGWMVRRGFFDRFVDGLEGRFPSSSVERVNAGIPGDTARGGAARVERVIAQNPDLVTVQFGLNDVYMGVEMGAFEAALRAIVKAVIAGGAVPVLCTSCPVAYAADQAMADPAYAAIRRIAELSSLPLADLERHWLDHADPDAGIDDHYQEDGVHPTDPGHELMAGGLLALFAR